MQSPVSKQINVEELLNLELSKNTILVTAKPILSEDGQIELLKNETELTERHYHLLVNAGINELLVKEVEIPKDLSPTEYKIEKKLTDIYSRNVKINVLTGDANTPIDEKHEESIKKTKEVFQSIAEHDDIPVNEIKDEVDKMLPDMLNNNDVLMRLRQLQETDDYLFEHSFRVSILATNLAKWLKYSENDIKNIAMASLLYEVGNLRISKAILQKPDKLTKSEMEIVKKHPQLAYHILLKTKGVSQEVKYVALQHHERIDGSGYPLKLRNNQIHDFTKIVMVCDIYDALTHDRPYRKKISPFTAAEYLRWQSGSTLDTQACFFLIKNLAEFYTGKKCLLNSNEEAQIVLVDQNNPTKPILKKGDEFIDLSKTNEYKIIDFID